MKVEKLEKVITPAVAAVVEKQIVLTLTEGDARTLQELCGYDSTVPCVLKKIGEVEFADRVLSLFRSLYYPLDEAISA